MPRGPAAPKGARSLRRGGWVMVCASKPRPGSSRRAWAPFFGFSPVPGSSPVGLNIFFFPSLPFVQSPRQEKLGITAVPLGCAALLLGFSTRPRPSLGSRLGITAVETGAESGGRQEPTGGFSPGRRSLGMSLGLFSLRLAKLWASFWGFPWDVKARAGAASAGSQLQPLPSVPKARPLGAADPEHFPPGAFP